MGGPTGLDYNVLFRKMDRMKLSAAEYDQLEEDVRVMEFEALKTMNDGDAGDAAPPAGEEHHD
jgi:hypothetical protein